MASIKFDQEIVMAQCSAMRSEIAAMDSILNDIQSIVNGIGEMLWDVLEMFYQLITFPLRVAEKANRVFNTISDVLESVSCNYAAAEKTYTSFLGA